MKKVQEELICSIKSNRPYLTGRKESCQNFNLSEKNAAAGFQLKEKKKKKKKTFPEIPLGR